MYSKKKSYSINTMTVLITFLILSFCNNLDCFNFLRNLNPDNSLISSNDIIIYAICGLSSSGRTSLLDIMRFSLPYILILFTTEICINNILSDNKKYFYIIRYGNYKNWIAKNFLKLFVIIVSCFTFYYMLIILIAMYFSGQSTNFSTSFFIVYPSYDLNTSFLTLLIFQYLLSLSMQIILVLIQFLLAIYCYDSNNNFIYLTLTIIILSFLGEFDCYNPLMLSKFNVLNSSLNYNPLTTIIICIITIFIAMLFMNKIVKNIYRR